MKHLILLISLIAAVAFSANCAVGDVFSNNKMYFTVTSEKNRQVELTRCDATGNVVIPQEVVHEGIIYAVTTIGTKACYSRESLTSVTIPNSVTEIRESAFAYCKQLTSVALGHSVTDIGSNAFDGCSLIKEISLPETLIRLGHQAFAGCISLEKMDLPESLEELGASAFSFCSIRTLTIPRKITVIPDNLCLNCKSLESVYFKGNVTTIGESAFEFCKALKYCVLPQSVTDIERYAFYECYSLTWINFPPSLKTIATSIIGACKSMEIIFALGKTPPTVPSSLGVPDDVLLYVPKGCVANYALAKGFEGITNIEEIDGIVVKMPKIFSIKKGETTMFDVAVLPIEGYEVVPELSSWKSSDETVVTVDKKSGLITGVGTGTAEISYNVTDTFGNIYSAQCQVTISASSSIETIAADDDTTTDVYSMQGVYVGTTTDGLPTGFYIIRRGSNTEKIYVK